LRSATACTSSTAAVDDLAAGVRAIAGEADLEVRGGRGGFPESVYATLARVPGVAVSSPMLELEAGLAPGEDGSAGTLRVIGLDPLRASLLQPQLFAAQPQQIAELLRPDTVLLTHDAARALRLGKGGRLQLVVGLHRDFDGGTLPPTARTARRRSPTSPPRSGAWAAGEPNRVGIRRAGRGPREGARRSRHCSRRARVSPVETARRGAACRAPTGSIQRAALVACSGGFLVFSAQALEVARRRGEHALLRVLGLERAGLARLVLVEAAALGAAGAALGLLLGYAVAILALRASGGDLGAGMFRGLAPQVAFAPGAALAYLPPGSRWWARCCRRWTRRAQRPRRR
jgi:putative ABC transport system permease protein